MAERIAPIPTRYADCHFRSRQEAKWAVFFDAAKITWQYEPQGYALPSGNYLPDFRIQAAPQGDVWTWFEVKPAIDLNKPLIPDPRWGELARLSGSVIVVAEGMHRGGDDCLKSHRSTAFSPHGAQARVDGLWRLAKFQDAWSAANSARFEFGESGRT
jgi:hypothetical protein